MSLPCSRRSRYTRRMTRDRFPNTYKNTRENGYKTFRNIGRRKCKRDLSWSNNGMVWSYISLFNNHTDYANREHRHSNRNVKDSRIFRIGSPLRVPEYPTGPNHHPRGPYDYRLRDLSGEAMAYRPIENHKLQGFHRIFEEDSHTRIHSIHSPCFQRFMTGMRDIYQSSPRNIRHGGRILDNSKRVRNTDRESFAGVRRHQPPPEIPRGLLTFQDRKGLEGSNKRQIRSR